jgi:MFS family permease
MESIVGSSATLTIMFGSWAAGYLIKSGRRKVLILGAVIGSCGAAITIYQNFYAIICGRLIYGFSCGLLAITMPRVMEETVPGELVGMFGGCYCLSFAFATLVAYAMAVFLPPENDTAALATSPVT